MIVPDVNLLVYAYDSKAPHHPQARAWWEGLLGRRNPGLLLLRYARRLGDLLTALLSTLPLRSMTLR